MPKTRQDILPRTLRTSEFDQNKQFDTEIFTKTD